MFLNFTGWKNGKCYLNGQEMPESEVWAILKAEKVKQFKELS